MRRALQASDSYRSTPLEQIQESVRENDVRIKVYALLCPIGFFEENDEEEEVEDKSRSHISLTLARDFGQLLVDEQWRRSVRSLQSVPIDPDQKFIDFNLEKADDLAKRLLSEQSDSCETKRGEDEKCEKMFLKTTTTRFEDEKMNSTIKLKK